MKEIKINTFGNQSPGQVHGDYKVTQTIINQYAITQSKKWRPLEVINYPPRADVEKYRLNYLFQIAYFLYRVSDGIYKDFTALFAARRANEENNLPIYTLISHHFGMIGKMRSVWSLLWDSNIPESDRMSEQRKINDEMDNFAKEYKIKFENPIFADTYVPWRFIYNPDEREVIISTPDKRSLSLFDYQNKLRTTSEILTFLAAWRQVPAGFIEGVEIIEQIYPLKKLFIRLLDTRAYDLNNILVNVHDSEEWDYLNPDFDKEIQKAQELKGSFHNP